MNSSTKITVLVCTYNRSQSLGTTLESVVSQALAREYSWEILVVDNNSSDETRKVVEGFQRRYPELVRYFLEPQQGVAHAPEVRFWRSSMTMRPPHRIGSRI